jgi:hypothetical protein
MEKEVKKPELDKPSFFREPYDYRNIEYAGQYRGVGERGKVGTKSSSSMDAMPPNPKNMQVPRDFKE